MITFRRPLVEAGSGPGVGAFGQAMFDGVVMDVVQVSVQVVLATDQMFPESALPNVRVAVFETGGRGRGSRHRPIQRPGEQHLHPADANGKIMIAWRQRPEVVHLARQNHAGEE